MVQVCFGEARTKHSTPSSAFPPQYKFYLSHLVASRFLTGSSALVLDFSLLQLLAPFHPSVSHWAVWDSRVIWYSCWFGMSTARQRRKWIGSLVQQMQTANQTTLRGVRTTVTLIMNFITSHFKTETGITFYWYIGHIPQISAS